MECRPPTRATRGPMRLLPLPRPAVAGVAAVAVIGVAGGVVAVNRLSDGHSHKTSVTSTDGGPAATPVVAVSGIRNGRVPWNRPITLTVTDGSLRQVSVMT